ncbi:MULTISPECIES: hypothetical protein [Alteribacter]|uniref:Uncharacterized protein n=1 Tax=Alteribacter keqinensis TaxID=2483800 RepID=A0A3M7TSM7_9BACI|nr:MULTISPECIES: hypothetical protein [Alteribacter]MBM7097457.1 hypothetical protein [Alteribacter salitolerans]RNA68606.1 hypothetical protein EBO34_01145 [Alteribacter keqinensis]
MRAATINLITFLFVSLFAALGISGQFTEVNNAPHWWLYPSIVWTFALFIQQIPHLWVKLSGLALACLSALFCFVFILPELFNLL